MEIAPQILCAPTPGDRSADSLCAHPWKSLRRSPVRPSPEIALALLRSISLRGPEGTRAASLLAPFASNPLGNATPSARFRQPDGRVPPERRVSEPARLAEHQLRLACLTQGIQQRIATGKTTHPSPTILKAMITPLDVKKHEFSVRLRGYDQDEVRALLETVAREMEESNRQNVALSERLKVAEERINHYRLIEKTLQDAVITMQNTLEEKRKLADQEADLIVQEARARARDELQGSREQVAALRAEIYSLENQKQQFFMRLRSILRTQSQMLEAMMEAEDRQFPPAMPPAGSDIPTETPRTHEPGPRYAGPRYRGDNTLG